MFTTPAYGLSEEFQAGLLANRRRLDAVELLQLNMEVLMASRPEFMVQQPTNYPQLNNG